MRKIIFEGETHAASVLATDPAAVAMQLKAHMAANDLARLKFLLNARDAGGGGLPSSGSARRVGRTTQGGGSR